MTLKQALTLAAFFAGFAVNAQAASIIDGDRNNWELHENGKRTDWAPDTSLSPRHTVEDRTEQPYLPNYRGVHARALDVHTDTIHLYLELITGLLPNTHAGPAHKRHDPADPKHVNLKHPTSIEAEVLLSHIGQLLYNSKPYTQMGVHKDNNPYVIETARPPLTYSGSGDGFYNHWPLNCANDDRQVTPESITVPEPTSLALLTFGLLALALILRSHKKPALSPVWEAPPFRETEPKSRFSSAKLLRRDIRNNTLLFKFLHQRKYNFL